MGTQWNHGSSCEFEEANINRTFSHISKVTTNQLRIGTSCNIAIIRICEMYICSYVVHTHRNPKKKRNTDDSLGSGTKLLWPSLSLGFRHEERDTQSFYADCSSIVNSQLTDSTDAGEHRAVHKLDWFRPGLKNQLASFKSKSQLTAFIQNH